MKTRLALLVIAVSILPSGASADAQLFVSPARGTYVIGDTFEVEIRADTGGEQSIAAEADIAFNPAALSVEKLSVDGSVLSLWPTEPTYSNAAGTIRFSGTANTSFNSGDALLLRVQFRALSTLPGDVRFDSGAVLLNDARATNVVGSMRSALYTSVPRQAEPPVEIPTEIVAEPTDTAETPEVKGASIQIPAISGYDDRVSIGSRIILRGSGAPSSKIYIYLQYADEAPTESALLTTADGSFTYVSSESAESGMYRAWAEVHADGEVYASEKVAISARPEGLVAAVEAVVPMLGIALPYVLLLIAAGASIGYLYNRKAAATHASS